jgi:flagellar biosynthetic protein FliP
MTTRKVRGVIAAGAALLSSLPALARTSNTGLDVGTLGHNGGSVPWNILVMLTVLTLLPAIVLSMTPFVRLLVVFHFLRQALGTQTTPSNQTLIGLSLILTFFLMQPVGAAIHDAALVPYEHGQIDAMGALDLASSPLRNFMLKYSREKDLALFLELAKQPKPRSAEELPMRVVIPAYLISELKAGFQIGAARFNQRDALATVLITAVNIVAGFLIGVFQLGIPFRDALQTYTVLTVGDGLVTMIPSLLVSMAGGLVVTRASSGSTLSSDLGKQLLSGRRPLFIAAGIMLTLAAIPGLPKFSFLLLAGLVGTLAWRTPPATVQAAQQEKEKQKDKKPGQEVEDLLKLDELAPRSGIRAGAAGRSATRRPLAGAGQGAAQQPGSATGIHCSAGTYHRQCPAGSARVCDLPARGGSGALGDARKRSAGHQLGCNSGPGAGNFDPRARVRSRRHLDRGRFAE